MKLSILMPVYNEERTIGQAIKRVLQTEFPCDFEVIAVDDGSRDWTSDILSALQEERLLVLTHQRNLGKGAAIRTALRHATGTHAIVFDADLEYSPEEIPNLLWSVINGDAEVIFGSRTFGSHTAFSFWYVMGNKAVTLFANVLFNSYISDLETCYKLLPIDLFRTLNIRSQGFGIEAEITGKLLRLGYRPFEVPISYRAREREAGKKLTWRDGVEALWILLRTRLRRPLPDARPSRI